MQLKSKTQPLLPSTECDIAFLLRLSLLLFHSIVSTMTRQCTPSLATLTFPLLLPAADFSFTAFSKLQLKKVRPWVNIVPQERKSLERLRRQELVPRAHTGDAPQQEHPREARRRPGQAQDVPPNASDGS